MTRPLSLEDLHAAQQFHGNVCLGLPLGLRVGREALDALNVPRSEDKELVAVAELAPEQFSHCFLDGLQWSTGCTLGKNNLILDPVGKFAVSLFDTTTGRAVRVTLTPAFLAAFRAWPPVAAKAENRPYQPAEGEMDRFIREILTRPAEEVVRVEQLGDVRPPAVPMYWDYQICSRCGEAVLASYTTTRAGDTLCTRCAQSEREAP
jgi:formylmethanofuran dehydrogenase subunit E